MARLTDWTDTDEAIGALVLEAEELVIETPEDYEAGVHLRAGLKRLIKEIQDAYRPIKKAQDEAKAVTLAEERRRLEGPQEALGTVNARLEAFEASRRRERMLAEARAAQEAQATGHPVPAVPVVEVPHVEGFGFSTHWTAEVTDKLALIQAVAAGQVTPDILEVVPQVANALARASKGAVTVPGLRFVATRRTRG